MSEAFASFCNDIFFLGKYFNPTLRWMKGTVRLESTQNWRGLLHGVFLWFDSTDDIGRGGVVRKVEWNGEYYA